MDKVRFQRINNRKRSLLYLEILKIYYKSYNITILNHTKQYYYD